MNSRHVLVAALAAALALAGCSSATSSPADGVAASAAGTDGATSSPGAPDDDATTMPAEPVATPSPAEPTATPTVTPTPDAEARAAAEEAAREAAEQQAAEEAAAEAAASEAAAAQAAEEAAAKKAAEEEARRISLQERLAELGYYTGAIDGVVGSGTQSAVRTFQTANGLTVDGVVGPQTRSALDGDPVTAGEHAAVIAAAQDDARSRLQELGYWGGSTWSAVMAFQKVNGLSADGTLGPATLAALDDPVAPPLVGGAATRIEIDLDRQVVHWISGGQRVRTMNASSGNGATFHVDGVGAVEALTPTGTFTVERRISGLREGALGGMYNPMYFFHGWAVHGSNSVPAYPASHGCVRLSQDDAAWLFPQAVEGTAVVVHGSRNTFVPYGPKQPPIL